MEPSCVICDYDLTGLSADARCPECGFERQYPAVQARLKIAGGDSMMSITTVLLIQFAAIGVGFIAFRSLLSMMMRQFGPTGVFVMLGVFMAWLAVVLFVLPRVVHRIFQTDGHWDMALIATPEGLISQLREPNAPQHATPWSTIADARLRRARRKDQHHIKVRYHVSEKVRLKFSLTYTIHADETLANAFHAAVMQGIESCRKNTPDTP